MAGSTVPSGITPAMILLAGTAAISATLFARRDRIAMTPLMLDFRESGNWSFVLPCDEDRGGVEPFLCGEARFHVFGCGDHRIAPLAVQGRAQERVCFHSGVLHRLIEQPAD